ncbi:MAG TPA: GMC family oxidoreductase N-terminal domain-containing protein [Gemmatirosa sp.]
MLARWAHARLPVQRTVFQALRRLTLAAWYGQPAVQAALGYRGPFHHRAPALPWEGPPAGLSSPREPIARADAPERVASPYRSTALPVAAAPTIPPRPGQPGSGPTATAGRIVPGRTLQGELRRTADVVVIGSGAGGAVVAARLAEAGREVVVLESGGLWTAADFTEREADLTERLYADQGLRATEDLGIAILQGDTVGGSTTVNWMATLRPDAHVREEWARRFGLDVATNGALDAALDRVWTDVHARPMPDDAHSANNRLLLDGAAALGWRTRALDLNARGCVRSGFCGLGCRYDAKQGTLMTYVPRALAAGATVYADATADRVTVLGPNHRRGVKRVVATIRGRDTRAACATLTVDAPTVVLAAGAVGTPALLQRSGLGGGGVGRYLRLHPTTAVTGHYDREVNGSTGVPMSTICDEFSGTGANGYGFWLQTPPLHPMLAAVATAGFGRDHFAIARDYLRTGAILALVRDGADLAQSNGSVSVDRRGRTRIRYRLGPTDARHLREGMAAAARIHLAAGADEARTLHTRPVVARTTADVDEILRRSTAPNDLSVFSAHVNGTCRLGRDPRTSGASSDPHRFGERHGAGGVHVADGSLLPTGVGVNPQATIMAMGHLVAGGLVAQAQ